MLIKLTFKKKKVLLRSVFKSFQTKKISKITNKINIKYKSNSCNNKNMNEVAWSLLYRRIRFFCFLFVFFSLWSALNCLPLSRPRHDARLNYWVDEMLNGSTKIEFFFRITDETCSECLQLSRFFFFFLLFSSFYLSLRRKMSLIF